MVCCIITCRTLLARLFCFAALASCADFVVVVMVLVWVYVGVFIVLLVVGGCIVYHLDLVY